MRKLKPQYEEFCRAYVEGANAGRSAVQAGYAQINRYHQGAKLLARPEIVVRIRELRVELAERESLHVESLLAKLETAYRQSIEAKNTLAAVRVIELQAKLAGLVGPQRGERTEKIADALAEADTLLARTEPKKPIARRAVAPASPTLVSPAPVSDVAANDAFSISPGELPERETAPEVAPEVASDSSEPEAPAPQTIYVGQPDDVRRAALLAVARSRSRKRLNVR